MRTIESIIVASAGAALVICALPRCAHALEEAGYTPPSRTIAKPGISAEGLLGSGLDSRYGLMAGARAGYTTDSGVYVGGNATRADGPAGTSDTLLGGEVGYRYFASPRFEMRPFGIVGADIGSPGNNLRAPTTATSLALVPGALAAYHFGPFFVSAEGRLQLLPTPVATSVLAGAGLTF